jgi:transcriptional regulator with XRE-family HTH domain
MRRALDMTQKEFAEKMELAVETVSRWENDHTGTGGFSEKLVRHNICALLYRQVLGVDYDPRKITEMRSASTCPPEPITMERVNVRREREPQIKAWGEAMAA